MAGFLLRAVSLGAFLLLSSCLNPSRPPTVTTSPPSEVRVETVAEGLRTVWALAFAPDGRLFVTEREGRIRVIENGTLRPEPWATVPSHQGGEQGLMGLALDPDFPQQPYIYVCYTYMEGATYDNRVTRLRDENDRGVAEQAVLTGMLASVIHDGCRLKFGPDGKLWITMGDASNRALAQDGASLNGKVLRLNPDGSIPADNPDPQMPIWTLGHRNPQGLAFHPLTHQPYVTEHGENDNDEINVLVRGANYAWPLAGKLNLDPFTDPIQTWTPTIAPGGATFFVDPSGRNGAWNNSLFFVTLKERDVRVLHLDPDDPTKVAREEILYDNAYGRIRDIIQGPDGNLYFGTSNYDGRGVPKDGDDHVYRIRVP